MNLPSYKLKITTKRRQQKVQTNGFFNKRDSKEALASVIVTKMKGEICQVGRDKVIPKGRQMSEVNEKINWASNFV